MANDIVNWLSFKLKRVCMLFACCAADGLGPDLQNILRFIIRLS